jgi:protein TonB
MADLFGSLAGASMRRPTRWWSSVPFSIVVHAVVLCAAVIAPLAATGTLPTPSSMMVFAVAPPPRPMLDVPAPPPVAAVPTAPVSVVPMDAPSTIAPERDVPAPTATLPSVGFTVPGGTGLALIPDGTGVTLPPPVLPPPAPMRLTSTMHSPTKTVDVVPAYPTIARAAKVSGVVIIEAVIGADGRVEDAKILRSIPMLDQAALGAVRQWRYTPTLLNGVAVSVILTVTVTFTLK